MVNENRDIVAVQPAGLAIESGNPRLVIVKAREIEVALKELVSLKPKPVMINGEQYLEFEDWQTLGQFTSYSIRTQDAVPIEVNGIQGAKARAELIDTRTGLVVGGAEAYCMRDEERWSTRPKYEYQDNKKVHVGDEPVPWFQLASMAQTRAGAKAYRNRLAWIAVLAGYRPTPAEEMTSNESARRTTNTDSKFFCQEHQTEWFKRGKMPGYAHPIGETGKWCPMPSDKPAEAVKTSQPSSVTTTPPKAPAGATQEQADWEALAGQPTQNVPDPAPEAQKKALVELGKQLGHKSPDETVHLVCVRLNVKGWADVRAGDAATIISDWQNTLTQKLAKKGA